MLLPLVAHPAGRVAGVPRAPVPFFGCGDGLVLVRGLRQGADPAPRRSRCQRLRGQLAWIGRRRRRPLRISQAVALGAPLPPGSALLCLPLVHQALGSTREELGGTSARTKREGT
jgi:hypothetical protein